jgi:hypothetical protein
LAIRRLADCQSAKQQIAANLRYSRAGLRHYPTEKSLREVVAVPTT